MSYSRALLVSVFVTLISAAQALTFTISSQLDAPDGSPNLSTIDLSSTGAVLAQDIDVNGVLFTSLVLDFSFEQAPNASTPITSFTGVLSDGFGNELQITGEGSAVLYDSNSLMFSGQGTAIGLGGLTDWSGTFEFHGKGAFTEASGFDGRVNFGMNLSSAPEPASLAALALGGALVLRRRRMKS